MKFWIQVYGRKILDEFFDGLFLLKLQKIAQTAKPCESGGHFKYLNNDKYVLNDSCIYENQPFSLE